MNDIFENSTKNTVHRFHLRFQSSHGFSTIFGIVHHMNLLMAQSITEITQQSNLPQNICTIFGQHIANTNAGYCHHGCCDIFTSVRHHFIECNTHAQLTKNFHKNIVSSLFFSMNTSYTLCAHRMRNISEKNIFKRVTFALSAVNFESNKCFCYDFIPIGRNKPY